MGRPRIEFYSSSLKELKLAYYKGLGEKEARHFLGQEYLSLGKGSQRYLAGVFSTGRSRIQRGVSEISASDFVADYSRQRRSGGGAKKKKSGN